MVVISVNAGKANCKVESQLETVGEGDLRNDPLISPITANSKANLHKD